MKTEPWWNTSGALSKKFPGIEKSSCWLSFSKCYDQTTARELRWKRWNEAHPLRERSNGLVEDLEDLALRATGRMPLSRVSHNYLAKKLRAGEELGMAVLNLIRRGKGGQFESLAEQIRLRDAPNIAPKRIIADAMEALLQYLERERRLPSNRKIRIEANRIRHTEWEEPEIGSTYKFGQKLRKNDRNYRVLFFDLDSETLQIVEALQWDETRWNEKHFSDNVTKLAGFAGLPRS